jgi:hypothetical protein
MALSRRDDGGSQFFITHSPQPHLDGRYTAFAHVVSGMDVVDRIQQGDVIQRIQIWDGKTLEEGGSSSRRSASSKKGGDGRPLFQRERQLTASCRPSSSRPWPSSSPLRLSPPSLWDPNARSCYRRSAAAS